MTVELTISCGCGRKMTPNAIKGAGHYRCGCGMRIGIEGLPVRPARQCPVMRGRRLCNRPKEPSADVCDTCAEQITRVTMTRPGLWRNVALADVKDRYDEERQRATHDYAAERQRESERQAELRSLRDFNVVYYVRVRPGVVKIGTTRHLPSRMGALRVEPSAVLAAEPGTQKLEAVRHKQFAHLQTGRYREDFELGDQLVAHIEALVAQHGEPYAVHAQIEVRQRQLAQELT